jgi:hypothetical protein
MPTLEEIIKTSSIIIHKGRYAYLKAESVPEGKHFMISRDETETTVVTEERFVESVPYKEAVKWFKLFEIKVSAPFIALGFLAKIAQTVADEGLNILIVSTFSKDYILVREETQERAASALAALGFPLEHE